MKLTLKFKDGEVIDRSKVVKALPVDVYQFLTILSREGFQTTMVGGTVRDFLIHGHFSDDFDIELRHPFDHSEDEWKSILRHLCTKLKDRYFYNVELLNFSIFRVHLERSTMECAPARLEVYQGDGPFGHSDFSHKIFSRLDYNESFKRRDFTFNAIAIEHKALETAEEFVLVDPFDGVSALESDLINCCSEDFIKDPVRILRLVRFKLRFGMNISKSLEDVLPKAELTKLTSHYIDSEALKTGPGKFFRSFFELVDRFKIAIPKNIDELRFLISDKLDGHIFLSLEEYMLAHLFSSKLIFDESLLLSFVSQFGLKQKFAKEVYHVSSFINAKDSHDAKIYLLSTLKSSIVSDLNEKEDISDFQRKLVEAREFMQSEQKRMKQNFPQHELEVVEKIMSKYFNT